MSKSFLKSETSSLKMFEKHVQILLLNLSVQVIKIPLKSEWSCKKDNKYYHQILYGYKYILFILNVIDISYNVANIEHWIFLN